MKIHPLIMNPTDTKGEHKWLSLGTLYKKRDKKTEAVITEVFPKMQALGSHAHPVSSILCITKNQNAGQESQKGHQNS